MQKAVKKMVKNVTPFVKTRLIKLNLRLRWLTSYLCSQKLSKRWGKFSYVSFRSKLRPPEFTQIANLDEDLLWDVANNFINYCLNDWKKLPDVVESTDK